MHKDLPLFPPQASTVAADIDMLFLAALAVSVFFSILIAGLIVYFAVRYRRRHPHEVGAADTTSMALELTWTVIPLVIAMGFFAWGAKVFFFASRPPANATEYFVVGKQWMWKFQHPAGQREINDLHIPVGRPIRLKMTSEDVIHALFVPAFRVKADVLPGRYTTLWFEATKVGVYPLFCAEYCGGEHSQMIGRVTVMEPQDYARWLEGSATHAPTIASGAKLFTTHSCQTCHHLDSAARAPVLAGVAGREVTLTDGRVVRADDSYLRESILSPASKVVLGYQPIMPPYQGQITEEELFELIRYVKELGDSEQPTGPAVDGVGINTVAGEAEGT